MDTQAWRRFASDCHKLRVFSCQPITVTVNVSTTAASQVTNQAGVSWSIGK
jgi:hypothetical protein